jgi:hypothetical protein
MRSDKQSDELFLHLHLLRRVHFRVDMPFRLVNLSCISLIILFTPGSCRSDGAAMLMSPVGEPISYPTTIQEESF